MKLKVKRRVITASDDWLKCCRYCKHYQDGFCKLYTYEVHQIDHWLEVVFESGKIQEGLDEVLHENKIYSGFFNDVQRSATRCGVSQKNLGRFHQGLSDCYDIFVQDSLPYLDGIIYKVIKNYMEEYSFSSEVCIDDPRNMVCNNWE